MQIYAFNEKRNLICASRACRHQNYFCLECRGIVHLRGGEWRRLHFYHISPHERCALAKKSLIHLQVQYALQKMLSPEEVLLEQRFREINRIADVVWPAKKLIFEVQCSPISAREIEARNNDYQQIGYFVVWIFHDRRFNRYKLTSAEYYLLPHPHYFTNINILGNGLVYDQWAFIRNGQRVKRTPRFPIYLKQLRPLNRGQISPQFPFDRQRWKLSFKGDLFHRPFAFPFCRTPKERFSLLKWIICPFRALFNLLLEKASD